MNVESLKRNIPGWSFFGCGVVMVAAGLFLYVQAWRFVRTAVHAEGTVTGLVEKAGKEKKTLYYPVCKFQDSQGAEHEIQSDIPREDTTKWAAGTEVPVLYQPDDPRKAKLDDFGDVWGLAFETCFIGAFFAGLGLVFLLIGFVVRKVRKRKFAMLARQACGPPSVPSPAEPMKPMPAGASGAPGADERADAPRGALPREVTYHWTPDLARNAAGRFAGKANMFAMAVILLGIGTAIFLAYLITGNGSGACSFLICCVIFYAVMRTYIRRGWQMAFKQMPDSLVTLSIAADTITFHSTGQVNIMQWSHIREMWIFPEVLLLFFHGRTSYTPVPVAPLGGELKKVIEDKVSGHGGKVTAGGSKSFQQLVKDRGYAEIALAYGTLMFLILDVPAAVEVVRKGVPGHAAHPFYGNIVLGMFAIWPVAHCWGYLLRNRVVAAIAALLHNLWASVIIGAVWFAWLRMHGSIGIAFGGSLFASCYLVLGFLMTRQRVSKKRMAVYIYFAISVLVIVSTMVEAWLEK